MVVSFVNVFKLAFSIRGPAADVINEDKGEIGAIISTILSA